jgi:hypothetical protein
MVKLLTELECEFLTATEKEIVGNIKEKISYIALDFEAEMKKYRKRWHHHHYQIRIFYYPENYSNFISRVYNIMISI